MQTFAAKYKVKREMREQAVSWARFLNERRDDVWESLRAEGVALELAFLDNQADGLYLIYVFKAEDIQKAFEVLKTSRREVDVFHKKVFSESFGKPEELKVLIDFENF